VFIPAAATSDVSDADIERNLSRVGYKLREQPNGQWIAGLTNVEFHLATIDKLPLPDASVDVVISNCVINLAPDKPAVFREIARVLKPRGRLAVSDIALKRPLPDEIAKDVQAYVGCIGGAIVIDEYRSQLREAGFAEVVVVDSGTDLNAYSKIEGQSSCCSPAAESNGSVSRSACCAPPKTAVARRASGSGCCGSSTATDEGTVHEGLAAVLDRYDVNDYAASVKVYAVRPG